MATWVLIVHLLGGGYAETFASEAGCRMARDELLLMAPGDSAPQSRPPGAGYDPRSHASCKQAGPIPARRDRPRRMVRAMA